MGLLIERGPLLSALRSNPRDVYDGTVVSRAGLFATS